MSDDNNNNADTAAIEAPAPEPHEPVCVFKKPKTKSFRKRKALEQDDDEQDAQDQESGSAVVRKNKSQKADNPFVQRMEKSEVDISTSVEAKKVAMREGSEDQGATASDWFQEATNAAAMAKIESKKRAEEAELDHTTADGETVTVYKGMEATKTKIERREQMPVGPSRMPTHIRQSCRWDYARDICKDWKETGYCGYGDSCKFMHDRGDYKSGWQLEKEYEEAVKKKRLQQMGHAVDDDEDLEIHEEADDAIPFACHICRKPFVKPVVTKCGHYFCERCAMDRYGKGRVKCAVCGANTQGIFNTPKDFEKKQVEQKKKREQQKAKKEKDDEDLATGWKIR